MSDSPNSTLSSPQSELERLLLTGFPPIDGPSDEDKRLQAANVAMAIAYTWIHHDKAAQEVFLDALLELNSTGLALMVAIEVYTDARLFGIQPGTLRADQEVTTRWTPSKNAAQLAAADNGSSPAMRRDWSQENVAVITDLWTGIATGNYAQMMRAKAELYEMPLAQVREVLRIMAYDASVGMDQFAGWQAAGADTLEDYRREVPLEPTPPPGVRAAQA